MIFKVRTDGYQTTCVSILTVCRHCDQKVEKDIIRNKIRKLSKYGQASMNKSFEMYAETDFFCS